MDATNTKYRIRQCSKCPGDLKYFCVTCSSDLCSQCKENHMMRNSNKDLYNVITYREKSNNLQTHEICVRHPNSVYTKYCELCKIPICTDCTDHRNHWQTDVGTAYEEKRQNREILKKIKNEALPIRIALLADIDLDFKTVISDVAHLNAKIIKHSEKITSCLGSELDLKNIFVKLKIKIKKYIANIYTYEHVYSKSSDAPIKFLLSAKKHQPKTFKKYGQIRLTPCRSLKTETIIEKLLTINSRDNGRRLIETEKITRDIRAQLNKFLNVQALCMFQVPILMDKISCTFSEGKFEIQGGKYTRIPDSNYFNFLFSNLELAFIWALVDIVVLFKLNYKFTLNSTAPLKYVQLVTRNISTKTTGMIFM